MADFATEQTDLGDIFAGMHPPIESQHVTLLTSPTEYTRGAAMGKISATGKYTFYNTGASDGTQTLAGILIDDVDASGADGIGKVYVHGEFLQSKIFNPSSPTGIPAGVYNSGAIVIKEAE